jgi:diacylglycerol kinase (ATP)
MHIAIATNTRAGNGKAMQLANTIQTILYSRNTGSTIFTEQDWDERMYLSDQVWICGGDGTVNFFINQYPDIKTPLAILKGGTGNDFHALLYGSVSTEAQVDLLLQHKTRKIDAGKCNERYFLNGVGIGFEGAVAKSLTGVRKWNGKTSFMLSILRHIFFYRSGEYQVDSPEYSATGRFLMISIANGTRYGGGFYVAPRAKPDDGLFDANLVKPLTPIKRLRYLPVIEKGKHTGLPFITYFNTRQITISSKLPIQAHLDGEYIESYKLAIELLPGHFNFIY